MKVSRILIFIFYFIVSFVGAIIFSPNITNIILIFLFIYVGTFIHECGHYLFARLSKIEIREVDLGNKKELFRFNVFGTPFVFKTGSGGITKVEIYPMHHFKIKYILLLFGGVLFQAIVLILLLIISKPSYDLSFTNITFSFVAANIIQICYNIMPFIYYVDEKVHYTDGMLILKTLFGKPGDINELLMSGSNDQIIEMIDEKNYDEAIMSCRKILNEYPDLITTKINYSMCLVKKLKYNEAQKILEDICELNIDNGNKAMIYNNLAWCYFVANDIEYTAKADELSELAFEIASDNAAIINTRGCVLIEEGQYDEGIELLEKQCNSTNSAVGGDFITNYIYLAYAYLTTGNEEMAAKYQSKIEQNRGFFEQEDEILYKRLAEKTIVQCNS